MSQRCYDLALLDSRVVDELPVGRWRRVGRGYQIVWDDLSGYQLSVITERVKEIRDLVDAFDDDGAAADRVAVASWLERDGGGYRDGDPMVTR